MPILVGTDGVKKMSKSVGNYIGITEPPKDIFGKIMSISDELMIEYYELLSAISTDDLAKLKKDISDNKLNPKVAKERLAIEIVARFWGKDKAKGALEEFERVFSDKKIPTDIPKMDTEPGEKWLPKLITDLGLTQSTSEAKRMISQGAVTIDGARGNGEAYKLKEKSEYILKVGKRKFTKIVTG